MRLRYGYGKRMNRISKEEKKRGKHESAFLAMSEIKRMKKWVNKLNGGKKEDKRFWREPNSFPRYPPPLPLAH
jgi:hypothetical protein